MARLARIAPKALQPKRGIEHRYGVQRRTSSFDRRMISSQLQFARALMRFRVHCRIDIVLNDFACRRFCASCRIFCRPAF
jgi:hypothetical protein